ncbi:hypothetical protein AN220_00705 [Streptomyces nanshensis]|nr:hypothetical protein AN220_00705 [Streptomyces nanshensis]
MKVTVCGVHVAKSPDPGNPEYKKVDGGEPFTFSAGGKDVEIHVCEECRPAAASTIHTLLMAGGVSAEETGMLPYMADESGDEEWEEDEGEEGWEEEEEDLDADDRREAADGTKSVTGLTRKQVRDSIKHLRPPVNASDLQKADNARVPENGDSVAAFIAQQEAEEAAKAAKAEIKAKRPGATPKPVPASVVRAWAKAAGKPVPAKGKLPQSLWDEFYAAQG